MNKTSHILSIDQKEAASIAAQLLDAFDGQPFEKTSTILSGIAVAMLTIAKSASEYATKKGMVEKMILSFFTAADPAGLQFSKYINLDADETDNSQQ